MEDTNSLIIGVGLFGGLATCNFINWLDESVARNDAADDCQENSFPYSAIAARPFYEASTKGRTDTTAALSYRPRAILVHRSPLSPFLPTDSKTVWASANFDHNELANVTLREYQRPLWESQEAYDSAIRREMEHTDALTAFHLFVDLPSYTSLEEPTISIENFLLDEAPKAALSLHMTGTAHSDTALRIFSKHLADYVDTFRSKSAKALIPKMIVDFNQQAAETTEPTETAPTIVETANLVPLAVYQTAAFQAAVTLDALSMPYRMMKLSAQNTLAILRPNFSPLIDIVNHSITSASVGGSPLQNDWVYNSAVELPVVDPDRVGMSNVDVAPFVRERCYRKVNRGLTAVVKRPYNDSARLFEFPEPLALPTTRLKNMAEALEGTENDKISQSAVAGQTLSYSAELYGGGGVAGSSVNNNNSSNSWLDGESSGYLTRSISWVERARLCSQLIGRSERDEWDNRLEILRDIFEESISEGLLPKPISTENFDGNSE